LQTTESKTGNAERKTESNAESKIITYFGFCIKAGKIVFGLDNAEKLRRAQLLVYDESLSENSAKKVLALGEKLHCPVLLYKRSLSEILHRDGCKVAAVTDKSLAGAILRTADGQENFRLSQGVGGIS
jgi:ribosomal protein L7Ae-like RNA K-turn-binding protein